MREADDAVEKVLAGLRDAEADAGFEERMIRRVRGAARERRASGWLGMWQWVGVGCVAVLLVGVGVNLRLREKRVFVARSVGSSGDAGRRTGLEHDGEIEEGVSQRLKPKSVLDGYGTGEAVPLSRSGLSGREATLRPTRLEDGGKQVGGDPSPDLPAGGFPAPPLPLTAQEKLLLRAAQQGGDAQPAAVLEVSVLPTHDAEETAEFVEFFEQDRQVEPSKPGENE